LRTGLSGITSRRDAARKLSFPPNSLPAVTDHGGRARVLGVKLADEESYAAAEHRKLLQAFAAQATLAIERVQLVKQAEQAQILQAREGLERALLNSISHDLRTPWFP